MFFWKEHSLFWILFHSKPKFGFCFLFPSHFSASDYWMTLLLLRNISTLCKVTPLACLMDRSFWAEEGCLIKQQMTTQLHNLSKKHIHLGTIWEDLAKLSPPPFCFFCLSLGLNLLSQPWQDRMVPLTGVSKDKENTHSGVTCTHTCTHTDMHAHAQTCASCQASL